MTLARQIKPPFTSNTHVNFVKALNFARRFAVVRKREGRGDVSQKSKAIVGLRYATMAQRPSFIEGKHENRRAYDHGQMLIYQYQFLIQGKKFSL